MLTPRRTIPKNIHLDDPGITLGVSRPRLLLRLLLGTAPVWALCGLLLQGNDGWFAQDVFLVVGWLATAMAFAATSRRFVVIVDPTRVRIHNFRGRTQWSAPLNQLAGWRVRTVGDAVVGIEFVPVSGAVYTLSLSTLAGRATDYALLTNALIIDRTLPHVPDNSAPLPFWRDRGVLIILALFAGGIATFIFAESVTPGISSRR